ncbi:MAG: CRISPR-associated endonuclease Cas3'' [Akkermansiaceae bacterium]|nr:CRISPR-associated endonuclease Cas3'' [Akkermansiaceae bacterium]
MREPLAHSARFGRETQSYAAHVGAVHAGGVARGERMLAYYHPSRTSPDATTLKDVLENAGFFHDLGKLDPGFQETLRNNHKSEDHIRHEDAGVAWLLENRALEAAGLVSAHHQGLVHYKVRTDSPENVGEIRASTFRIDCAKTQTATAQRLDDYLAEHERWMDSRAVKGALPADGLTGLTRRLLLSCLVDADHSDTAAHYGNEALPRPVQTRWQERLEALDRYVEALPRPDPASAGEGEMKRQEIRDRLYHACRDAGTANPMRRCDAVVGSGKTTAVMAHLLQVAATRNLRHIIIVVPYTNIITQTVGDLREAICLDEENPEEVVAEHHHQVEFSNESIRHLSTLWRAPVIVTTAVQFFETLAANKTCRLRKLHELPGSAVCLDEAHAALPVTLWPICWRWLKEWIERWDGHLVLASGSLPSFWKIDEFRLIVKGKNPSGLAQGNPEDLENLAPDLKLESETAEHARVKFQTINEPLTPDELLDRVAAAPGPRILVVNTVHSAAMLAHKMREENRGKVVHLSTALTPAHRSAIVERIKRLLRTEQEWTLIATSLVEAGMNFSFASGFRQRASVASLIQLGGRVNRHGDRVGHCFVTDFDFVRNSQTPDNPALTHSKAALSRLFERKWISSDKPADLSKICLAAMEVEFQSDAQKEALGMVEAEWFARNYPEVAEKCRIIQTEAKVVVIDPNVIARIKRWEKVSSLEVSRGSVQIYPHKITNLALKRLSREKEPELYEWPEGYVYEQDFLGYMAQFIGTKASDLPSGHFI